MTLSDFFVQNPRFAVAFSGGVDSSFLICSAKKANVSVKGYYVKSEFQPKFETQDVLKLASGHGLDIEIIETKVLSNQTVSANPADRCYYCKKLIFTQIIQKAKTDGFSIVCDGTNASDDPADRPGFRALQELGVVSPLRLCNLTKENIRAFSRELSLFTANKPAYACLATRISTNQQITEDILKKIEKCETALFELGFTDFRVRVIGTAARLQITPADFGLLAAKRSEVSQILLESFSDAVLDLKTVRLTEGHAGL
ncbi:MAG: ATP-dependent sacrificial sulfur transferase LarE [Spirochaetes bacterium]|nr:ATP-dependent sacrificial sulfur transferase LarE [Spirochaetota bacterium]